MSGSFGLVKPFLKVVVQIRIFHQRCRHSGLSQKLRFGNTAMPFFCGEITLADPHQRIELDARRRRERRNCCAQLINCSESGGSGS